MLAMLVEYTILRHEKLYYKVRYDHVPNQPIGVYDFGNFDICNFFVEYDYDKLSKIFDSFRKFCPTMPELTESPVLIILDKRTVNCSTTVKLNQQIFDELIKAMASLTMIPKTQIHNLKYKFPKKRPVISFHTNTHQLTSWASITQYDILNGFVDTYLFGIGKHVIATVDIILSETTIIEYQQSPFSFTIKNNDKTYKYSYSNGSFVIAVPTNGIFMKQHFKTIYRGNKDIKKIIVHGDILTLVTSTGTISITGSIDHILNDLVLSPMEYCPSLVSKDIKLDNSYHTFVTINGLSFNLIANTFHLNKQSCLLVRNSQCFMKIIFGELLNFKN